MKTPRVSIIVPVYNVAQYLPKCMDSLVNQTLSDIEIICIDDKSTDNSFEILRQYGNKYPHVHVIALPENGGISIARNTGFDVAHGEYIGFVDPDDYVELDFYEKMYNAITSENADLVICGTNVVYEADESLKQFDDIYFAIKDTTTREMTLDVERICSVCVWNKLYRREIINKYDIRFPVGLKHEDEYFFHAYCPWVGRVAFVADKLYNYRRRAGSIMNVAYSGHRRQINRTLLDIAIEYYKYATSKGILSNRKDWYWGGFFYHQFSNAFHYTSRSMRHKLYDEGIKFINDNYSDNGVTFNTHRKIQIIKSRMLRPRKYLFGIVKIQESAEQKDFYFGRLCFYRIKYSPQKSQHYLFNKLLINNQVS